MTTEAGRALIEAIRTDTLLGDPGGYVFAIEAEAAQRALDDVRAKVWRDNPYDATKPSRAHSKAYLMAAAVGYDRALKDVLADLATLPSEPVSTEGETRLWHGDGDEHTEPECLNPDHFEDPPIAPKPDPDLDAILLPAASSSTEPREQQIERIAAVLRDMMNNPDLDSIEQDAAFGYDAGLRASTEPPRP